MRSSSASQPEPNSAESAKRFDVYLDRLSAVVNNVKREICMRAYCLGLLLESDRKSIEPIAERLTPNQDRVSATHQSLHHFIANAEWDDAALLASVREFVLPAITQHAPISVWIADDTGIPKQGQASVGVAHQYCGQLGKQSRCQVAVTLSVANADASLPIAYQLYLPAEWHRDGERKKRAGVPDDIAFATKPEIALKQVRTALDSGVPRGTFVGDAGYGNDTKLRDQLTAWGVLYAVTVQETTLVWAPGTEPLPPKPWNGKGRKPTTLQRDDEHRPISVKQLAKGLPKEAYQQVEWREGAGGTLTSRFARVRVRAAHGETHTQREPEWLLIEWPEGAEAPLKYWLSTLPESTEMKDLVQTVQMRWRIEHDFLELKNELGLNQFEGRNWRGFHHHASMCIAAYGFLLSERGSFSPSGSLGFKESSLPKGRPRRGSPNYSASSQSLIAARMAAAPRKRVGPSALALPLLQAPQRIKGRSFSEPRVCTFDLTQS
jgi:SRSO17 transposase